MIHVLLALSLFLAPAPQDVRDYTVGAEGRTIAVRHYAAPYGGAPTVVIVHDWGSSMRRWEDIAAQMQHLGFSVVLFDLAGHGIEGNYYLYTDEQVAGLGTDVATAVDFARRTAGGEVYLIGAGLGANLALEMAAADETIGKVVAISPGMYYRGVRLRREMGELLNGRVMLLSSQEDIYSTRSIELFRTIFENDPPVQFYNNAGHGVWIIKRVPEALGTIARWLSGE